MEQNAVLDALIDALAERQTARVKAAGSTPTTVYAHGNGGLLSPFGLSPGIVNAMVMPTPGLMSRLPVRLSNESNPLRGVLTGQTASSGTEPTTACADATTPGNLKLCTRALPFGRLVKDSQVLQVDRVGEIINRGEFLDHHLIGDPFADMQPLLPVSARDMLRAEHKKKLAELMIALARDYGELLYNGSAVNTIGNTGYIEYYGLDYQVNTGYQDAITRQACAAVDSIVESFGSVNVATNPNNTVLRITELFNALMYESKQTGLDPMTWAIVGRYSLFRELTNIWPCSYLTYRCSPSGTSNQQTYDAAEAVRLRDDMRANSYLLIDGIRVEYIVDDFIAETQFAGGTFQSDLYFVPMTSPKFVESGGNVTYMEYFNFGTPNGAMDAAREFAGSDAFQLLGGGRYLLHRKPPTNWCVQIGVVTKPRLIIEAPFLAARLTNVRYTPTRHERNPLPDAPSFFEDGGRENYIGYGPSYERPTS